MASFKQQDLWGRNNDNILKAKKQGLNLTKKQLKEWKVKYCKYSIFIYG